MKPWSKPTLVSISSNSVQSANLQVNFVFEILTFTLSNTCTLAGADCPTGDGVVYTFEVSASGVSPNGFGPGSPGYQAYGVFATCVTGIQCS